MLTNKQFEELNHAALEAIAAAFPAALPLASVRRRIKDLVVIDFDYEDRDLVSSIAFLGGLRLVKETTDGFGTSKFYAATSEGVLAQRRGSFNANP
jgi:hypothetical protein